LGRQMGTVTTSKGLGDKIVDSAVGFAVGLGCVTLGVGVIWWGERRAVRRRAALLEMQKKMVVVEAGQLAGDELEGKLVCVSAPVVAAGDLVADKRFNLKGLTFAEPPLAVQSEVQQFQYYQSTVSETKREFGGGESTKTSYTYPTEWRSSFQSSDSFEFPEGHRNAKSALELGTHTSWASGLRMGEFDLDAGLLGYLSGPTDLRSGEGGAALSLASDASQVFKPHSADWTAGRYYSAGADAASPAVGALRVTLRTVKPGVRTLIAQVRSRQLREYRSYSYGSIAIMADGKHSGAGLIEAEVEATAALAYFTRIGGWVLNCVGCCMILAPTRVLLEPFPIIRDVARVITTVAGVTLGSTIAGASISVAWLIFHPLYLAGTLTVVGGSAYLYHRLQQQGKSGAGHGAEPAGAAAVGAGAAKLLEAAPAGGAAPPAAAPAA
jgi:hypothetical protein